MTVKFLVAKYIPDLKRREPRNVGVMLNFNGRMLCKFQGQRPDGVVDGRSVRTVSSVKAYKAWVHFWTDRLRKGAFDELVTPCQGQQSYFVEHAGELVAGYASVDALGLWERVQRGYRFTVRSEHGAEDEVFFDYRFDNSAINLMHEVSLVFADPRGWDNVHAAAWKFRQVMSNAHGLGPTQVISLVKTRPTDKELARQLGVLGECSKVVDVQNQDRATGELAELLHVPRSAPAAE